MITITYSNGGCKRIYDNDRVLYFVEGCETCGGTGLIYNEDDMILQCPTCKGYVLLREEIESDYFKLRCSILQIQARLKEYSAVMSEEMIAKNGNTKRMEELADLLKKIPENRVVQEMIS